MYIIIRTFIGYFSSKGITVAIISRSGYTPRVMHMLNMCAKFILLFIEFVEKNEVTMSLLRLTY